MPVRVKVRVQGQGQLAQRPAPAPLTPPHAHTWHAGSAHAPPPTCTYTQGGRGEVGPGTQDHLIWLTPGMQACTRPRPHTCTHTHTHTHLHLKACPPPPPPTWHRGLPPSPAPPGMEACTPTHPPPGMEACTPPPPPTWHGGLHPLIVHVRHQAVLGKFVCLGLVHTACMGRGGGHAEGGREEAIDREGCGGVGARSEA